MAETRVPPTHILCIHAHAPAHALPSAYTYAHAQHDT